MCVYNSMYRQIHIIVYELFCKDLRLMCMIKRTLVKSEYPLNLTIHVKYVYGTDQHTTLPAVVGIILWQNVTKVSVSTHGNRI